jgi:hypothetical protein
MRSSLLWIITQCMLVVVGDVSGQPVGSIFKGEMGPIGCPKMSVNVCQHTPLNIPEGHKIFRPFKDVITEVDCIL